jgi:hydrogenase large subunit
VRAVEDALGIQIPKNARLIRNIIEAIQYIQDHVVHFYHLHALDWVDITSALKADPKATSDLAQSISDWDKSSEDYFRTVQKRIQSFVDSGQLGLFGNAYWRHMLFLVQRIHTSKLTWWVECQYLWIQTARRQLMRIRSLNC